MDDDEDEENEGGSPEIGGRPKPITLHPSEATFHYLTELIAMGMHGKKPTTVVNRLVDEGIRRAITDGLIEKRRR